MTIALCVVALLVGLVLFCLADGKAAQIGLATFTAGLIAFLLQFPAFLSTHLR